MKPASACLETVNYFVRKMLKLLAKPGLCVPRGLNFPLISLGPQYWKELNQILLESVKSKVSRILLYVTWHLSHVRKNTDKPNRLVRLFKTTHGLYSDYTHQNDFYLTVNAVTKILNFSRAHCFLRAMKIRSYRLCLD